ncbi:MAG: type II secretion system F family protein, partial [Actinomycetota bacterium]
MSEIPLSEPLLIPAGLAAAFLALVVILAVSVDALVSRRQVYRSLQTVREADMPASDVRRQELAVPFVRRVVLPGLAGIGRLIRRFTPAAVVKRLDDELVYAGSPAGWDGARMFALKVAVAVIFAVGAALFLPVAGFGFLRTVVLVPFVGVVGYYLPEWILRSRSGRRQHRIRRMLPDALDLMSITVEAGLGFDAAMDRVSREMGGPLGEELHRVVQEMRLGKGRSEALRDLAERTTVEELRSFVFAMVQAEIFGISVARV